MIKQIHLVHYAARVKHLLHIVMHVLQSELDSKVEQFTKKLAGEPVTPHISSGTVQFTPTPSKPSQQYGMFHKDREYQVCPVYGDG